MAIFLPDVNVLLALAWPPHTHHQEAHDWLTGLGTDQWAMCAITEVGFVRILSNEKFVAPAATPHRAIEMLHTMMTDSRHLFWQSELQMRDPNPDGAAITARPSSGD